MSAAGVQRRLCKVTRYLESRMLGNLHVRFGVGARVRFPGLHHMDSSWLNAPILRILSQMMPFMLRYRKSGDVGNDVPINPQKPAQTKRHNHSQVSEMVSYSLTVMPCVEPVPHLY